MSTPTGAPRGFAAMSPEKRREIAARGGAAVPNHKRSFSQDRDLAAAAGRLGGEASAGSPNRSPKAATKAVGDGA